jgi:hypothetical protein
MDVHFSLPFIIVMAMLFGMHLTITLWDVVYLFVERRIQNSTDDEDDDDESI